MTYQSLPQSAPVVLQPLSRREILRLEPPSGGARVLCRAGRLWVTQEGDARDYVVAAGQSFEVTSEGVVLVQAIEQAVVSIG